MPWPLLILVFPVLELWLMITLGSKVGALTVIAWLILMIIVGLNLLRYLGASSMLRTAKNMRMGGAFPAQALAANVFKAVGAVLLIIPGFISDFIALLCFIPLVRQLLLKYWLAKIATRASRSGFAGFTQRGFRPTPFDAQQGNIYDHQGPAQPEDQTQKNSGVLIDQYTDGNSPSHPSRAEPPVDKPKSS